MRYINLLTYLLTHCAAHIFYPFAVETSGTWHSLAIEFTHSSLYTVSQKTCDYPFYNNFNNRCPITIIFGIFSSKSMRHRKMVSFPTSPI